MPINNDAILTQEGLVGWAGCENCWRFLLSSNGVEDGCCCPRGKLRQSGDLYVVTWSTMSCSTNKVIEKVHPPTELKRPYVANVTQVAPGLAHQDPDFNTCLIDRFWLC